MQNRETSAELLPTDMACCCFTVSMPAWFGCSALEYGRRDLVWVLEPERVIQPLVCALRRPTRQSRPAEKPRTKP